MLNYTRRSHGYALNDGFAFYPIRKVWFGSGFLWDEWHLQLKILSFRCNNLKIKATFRHNLTKLSHLRRFAFTATHSIKRNSYWKKLHLRMKDCSLRLHPKKTRLVYCRDFKRQGKYETVKFDFLGFSFQPRTAKSRRTGKLFLGYDCAVSISSRKQMADRLGDPELFSLSFKSIVGIAKKLNPIIRGWIRYYGKFRGYELSKVFYLLRCRLVRWARKRYKRYRTNLNNAYKWLDRVRKQFPYLFYHWQIGFSN